MYSLRDKIVFITGASSGIGASCARAFATQGARVLMVARRLERIEALASELHQEHGVASHAFQFDVRDQPAVESVTVRSLVNPESTPVRFVAESIRQQSSPDPGHPVPRSCRRKRAGG